MSWEDIDKNECKSIFTEITKEEHLIANLFNSKEGKKVLDILREMAYNQQSPKQVMCSDGGNSIINLSMMLGEQNFYRKIELILTKVKNYGKI